MQKRFLLSAGLVVILFLGLGLATRGDSDEAISELTNTERELLLLEQLIERVGLEGPEGRVLRQRLQGVRKLLQDSQVSQVLRMLEADEVTDQQLREAIVLLAKETLVLRDRVAKLEQRTSVRIIPAN